MQNMTEDEIRAFMRTGSRTGKIATVRADGSPHVVPIWFEFDDATGDLIFMTGDQSLKAKNIIREPRVSIAVDDETFPYAWARLDGTASTSTEDLVHWATETSRRFVGDDRAEEYGRRNGVEGEVIVRVTPTRLVGQTDLAG
jgi:PPOX class probable F420-dependent enzyme